MEMKKWGKDMAMDVAGMGKVAIKALVYSCKKKSLFVYEPIFFYLDWLEFPLQYSVLTY